MPSPIQWKNVSMPKASASSSGRSQSMDAGQVPKLTG